jgi:hypothetical protein
MTEQDPENPGTPSPKRRRKGHFDPTEEVPFSDDLPPPQPSAAPLDARADADVGASANEGSVGKSDDDDDGIPFGPDDEEFAQRWDADDPRRQKDQMAPPAEPYECYCLHCGRTFSSDKIWFQKVIGARDGFDGFWMCPTPNCGGAGFTFDIFPTDPEHPANAGWTYTDDDEDEEDGDAEWTEESGSFVPPGEDPDGENQYDPGETKYKQLDELYGDAASDDDLEGEEWKYGLQPGERPEPQLSDEARREREEEQRKYDMPDERPRELDWTNREEEQRPPRGPSSGDWRDDDIPF